MTSIYAASTKGALATAALTDLQSAGTAGCTVKIYNASDSELGNINLSDPPGVVTLNRLQINPLGTGRATVGGTASYARINKADGSEFARLACVAGTAAVANSFVLASVEIVVGATLAVNSFYIGDT